MGKNNQPKTDNSLPKAQDARFEWTEWSWKFAKKEGTFLWQLLTGRYELRGFSPLRETKNDKTHTFDANDLSNFAKYHERSINLFSSKNIYPTSFSYNYLRDLSVFGILYSAAFLWKTIIGAGLAMMHFMRSLLALFATICFRIGEGIAAGISFVGSQKIVTKTYQGTRNIFSSIASSIEVAYEASSHFSFFPRNDVLNTDGDLNLSSVVSKNTTHQLLSELEKEAAELKKKALEEMQTRIDFIQTMEREEKDPKKRAELEKSKETKDEVQKQIMKDIDESGLAYYSDAIEWMDLFRKDYYRICMPMSPLVCCVEYVLPATLRYAIAQHKYLEQKQNETFLVLWKLPKLREFLNTDIENGSIIGRLFWYSSPGVLPSKREKERLEILNILIENGYEIKASDLDAIKKHEKTESGPMYVAAKLAYEEQNKSSTSFRKK